MEKLYLLELHGINEHEYKLVTEEIFKWITSKDMGIPDGEEGSAAWHDTTTPDSVKNYMRDDGNDDWEKGASSQAVHGITTAPLQRPLNSRPVLRLNWL